MPGVRRTTISPPAWVVTALAAQRLLVRRHSANRNRSFGAAALAAAAAGLFAETAARFRAADTTILPEHPEDTTSLTIDGANRFSRNPIYLAMALLLTGNAIRLGNPRALLPVAGFVALMTTTQIAAEEEALQQQFGTEYGAYCRTVRRWI